MISIVFPFYNESKRIDRFREGLKSYTNPNNLIQELILVDDGSTDNTLSILKEIQKELTAIQIKVIEIPVNQGKGNAIKTGIFEASQPWILCNDADLSYPMDQIDEWYEKNYLDFKTENTVYFGSRELGKKNNEMKLFLHRIVIGRIFALFIRLITGVTVEDTQCGYKLYEAGVARNIFYHIIEKRFAFDVEVHYWLKKMQIDIRLLPVRCYDVPGSKVNLIKDSFQMFIALFRIVSRN